MAQIINGIDYGNRLPRDGSYARKGDVTKIVIKENSIEAKVTDSQSKPYNVDIALPPFFDPQLRRFNDVLAQRPVIISKLLNRDLVPEVLSIAKNMRLRVFSSQWADFKMQCSSPDWAVHCIHLATVIYKISAEVVNNPFLVFIPEFVLRKEKSGFKKPGAESLSGGIAAWLQKYYLTQGNYKPQIVVTETLNDKFLISINILSRKICWINSRRSVKFLLL